MPPTRLMRWSETHIQSSSPEPMGLCQDSSGPSWTLMSRRLGALLSSHPREQVLSLDLGQQCRGS